jgi:hypothetical protein
VGDGVWVGYGAFVGVPVCVGYGVFAGVAVCSGRGVFVAVATGVREGVPVAGCGQPSSGAGMMSFSWPRCAWRFLLPLLPSSSTVITM